MFWPFHDISSFKWFQMQKPQENSLFIKKTQYNNSDMYRFIVFVLLNGYTP